jgi:hypothetical protein
MGYNDGDDYPNIMTIMVVKKEAMILMEDDDKDNEN